MLLATYQNPKNIDNTKPLFQELKSALGYYPILCFLAQTPQIAIVESMLKSMYTKGNQETDIEQNTTTLSFLNVKESEFVMRDFINIAGLESFYETGKNDALLSAINDAAPGEKHVYLLPQEEFQKYLISEVNISDVLHGEFSITFDAPDYLSDMEKTQYLKTCNEIYTRLKYDAFAFYMNRLIEKQDEKDLLLQEAFHIFLMGLFSYLCNESCNQSGVYVLNYPTFIKRENELRKLSIFEEDLFMKAYDMLTCMTWNIFWDNEIERNHKCPCGSGLKFKKCHGKYA